jgi:hypothetical protein
VLSQRSQREEAKANASPASILAAQTQDTFEFQSRSLARAPSPTEPRKATRRAKRTESESREAPPAPAPTEDNPETKGAGETSEVVATAAASPSGPDPVLEGQASGLAARRRRRQA